MYRVDVSTRTLNRDKAALGTSTVVPCSNTLIAPALGGLTEVGIMASVDGIAKSIDSTDATHVIVDDSALDEESSNHEKIARLIRGLRVGTPIVNLTNRSIEVTGSVSFGNGITSVLYLHCKDSPECVVK